MTTWSILLDESCQGKEKYRSIPVVREHTIWIRDMYLEQEEARLRKEYGDRFVSLEIGPKPADVLPPVHTCKLTYKDFDHFVDVENVSQLMDIFQRHPNWVLGRKYTGSSEPVTFFDISDWEMP